MPMKRLATPKMFPITRKTGGKFVTEPRPGPHPKNECIPLSILVRNSLGFADTALEAKTAIKSGKILIDSRIRKDHKYPTGIFDSITVSDENFRIILTTKGFGIAKIDKDEANVKLCKIVKKTSVKGGKIQINLNDGKNILAEKNNYKTGDTLLIGLPKLEIKKHIKRAEGSLCMITRGKNRSSIGTLMKIDVVKGSRPNRATVKLGDSEIMVPEDMVFVIGDEKAEITVSS